MANTIKARVKVVRRGRRRVSSTIDGAPRIMPTAKTVIASPERAIVVSKSVAISGRSPATTNSVVPIRKVPAATTYITNGSGVLGTTGNGIGVAIVSAFLVVVARAGQEPGIELDSALSDTPHVRAFLHPLIFDERGHQDQLRKQLVRKQS